MIKKILPVGIAIVLIIAIALTVSGIKKANNRTPKIDNADKVYVSYNDLDITYDRLYAYMRKDYGVNEMLDMVDELLFKDQIDALDVNSEDYLNYVKNALFSVTDFTNLSDDEKESVQDAWNEAIESLRLTNLLTAAEAQNKDYTDLTSPAWTQVKKMYRLAYVRENWAKDAYWKKYLEANERTEEAPFDLTNYQNSSSSIEAYWEENYSDEVIGLFIPFTSKEAALAAMESVGINVDSHVISANQGWVKSSYDYYTKEKVEDSDKMTAEEVVNAFVALFNLVYGYQNNNQPIINNLVSLKRDESTAYLVGKALIDTFGGDDLGVKVTLPEVVALVGDANGASVTWSLSDSTYATLENNVLSGKFEDEKGDKIEVTLNFKVTVGEEKYSDSVIIELHGEQVSEGAPYTTPDGFVEAKQVADVTPWSTYTLDDATKALDDKNYHFVWNKEVLANYNSTLSNYLSTSSSNLTIQANPDNFYKSYTLEPVSVGNYYALMIKFEESKQADLFKRDADGNIAKNDNDEYSVEASIADNDLYKEIVAAKKEALLTDNAISEMLYENRYNHDLKIYDAYLNAIYKYQYTNFYESTLAANSYNEYKDAKKNQKKNAFSINLTEGDKKSKTNFTAQDLFDRLESKYASSTVTSLLQNYILISNEAYNNIYNPFTNKVLNEDTYKNLVTAEVSSLRKNFESDYFTYAYLSYYGFTPAFPASYGWKRFIKDYFIALSDQELLTVSTYGGTIYSEALKALTNELEEANNYKLIMDKIDANYDDWYSASVVNLLVTLDFDYNADSSSSTNSANIIAEKDNWTPELEAEAETLTALVYKYAYLAGQSSLADNLSAMVELYKEAAYEYDEAAWAAAYSDGKSPYEFNYFGRFKLAGLQLSTEAANTYDSTSQILSEFADVAKDLWKEAEALDLLDKTVDSPIISDGFRTDYGWHKIALLVASKKIDKPTVDEIKIYRLKALMDDAQSDIDSAQSNIDQYSKSGYNTTTYEAQKAYAETKYAEYKAEYDALLAAGATELDSTATAKIDAWYKNAVEKIEGGTMLTRHYLGILNGALDQIKFNDESLDKAKLADFLALILAQCDEKDAE